MNRVCDRSKVVGLLTAAVGCLLYPTATQAAAVDNFDSYATGLLGNETAQNVWTWSQGWTVSGASARGAGQGLQVDLTKSWTFIAHKGGEEAWAVGQTATVQSDFRFQIDSATTTPQPFYMGLFQGDDPGNPWGYSQLHFGIDFVANQYKNQMDGMYQFTAYDVSGGGTNYRGITSGGQFVDATTARQIPGLAAGVGTSDWLRLTTQVTKRSGGTVDITMTLLDLGADGTLAPTVETTWTSTGFAINSDVYNASTVTGAYVLENPSGLTALYADNFAMSVPEPTSLGLLALGACGLLNRRRRHAE